MHINASNHGTLQGRLTSNPVAFPNRDGSVNVQITLAVERNGGPTDNNGNRLIDPATGFRQTYEADRIQISRFVRADRLQVLNAFETLAKGDRLLVAIQLEAQPYTDDQGVTQYPDVRVAITDFDYLDSKAEVEARRARDGVVPGINFPKGRPAGAPQVQGYGQPASGPAQGGFPAQNQGYNGPVQGGFAPQNQGYNGSVQGGFPAAQNAGTWGGPQS